MPCDEVKAKVSELYELVSELKVSKSAGTAHESKNQIDGQPQHTSLGTDGQQII